MSPADDVRRLAGHRVLVVGDLVLDEYVTGRPARLSREAPVMVLELTDQEDRAGSAASPAANIVALGSQASVVGVLGCDAAGERVEASLARLGIDCQGLVRSASASTAIKTRILAQGFTGGLHGRQQVLRLDRVAPAGNEGARACAEAVRGLAPDFDAVLLSDYRGGVIGLATMEAARNSGRPLFVDSQGDVRRFRGVNVLKLNQAEARAALSSGDLVSDGDALRRELSVHYLVVTLGAEGMLVLGDKTPARVPAVRATEVFDVTGAGDTVIAVLTLALVAGLPIKRAAEMASAAASVVVRKLGVATASPDELLGALG
ncbi:MAG TPA: PfkB family carbohydrate kinase [Chloroflexota bacterium]|nr:PfkB family carbohydrate kinase [Chloroflexota bacterium]